MRMITLEAAFFFLLTNNIHDSLLSDLSDVANLSTVFSLTCVFSPVDRSVIYTLLGAPPTDVFALFIRDASLDLPILYCSPTMRVCERVRLTQRCVDGAYTRTNTLVCK